MASDGIVTFPFPTAPDSPERAEQERILLAPKCPECNDTGKVRVSYASAENGPTDDPADESGIEFCRCDIGHAAWYKDAEENEAANKAYFERTGERMLG